ncbi:MAG: rhamnulokinase [Ruminococcaceae bacterium]|nr:rhamnulokinase [Oscillospiraceae bacterium]
MMEYYLAIDIGASSGRHILGSIDNGRLTLKEIYRFDNELKKIDGSLCWDIDRLEREVKTGIRECAKYGIVPKTVAIDTWGVDYVLLDKAKNPLLPVYAYRDSRTESSIGKVESIVSPEELYSRTGIQKLNFNTVYQLYCDKESGRLDGAEYYLMMPEYLSYTLTGKMKNEYTNATTTGMVNANQKTWDKDIIQRLGFPERLFGNLSLPGEYVGNFTEEMKEYAGFDSRVILCPSHDTASAVLACPLEENGLYVSSGTWSLIGTEITEAVLGTEARLANFTNEGGINYRFRFLKNYMGMWLLQNIRKNLNKKYTYDEMMDIAEKCGKVTYIDVNDPRLTAPENMIEAVRLVANNKDMPLDEVINCVYHSLARSYDYALKEISRLTGKTIDSINIVGGGSADKYLNRLTAEYTGKRVYAGPREATALGNIVCQMMTDVEGLDVWKARKLIKESFNIEESK